MSLLGNLFLPLRGGGGDTSNLFFKNKELIFVGYNNLHLIKVRFETKLKDKNYAQIHKIKYRTK